MKREFRKTLALSILLGLLLSLTVVSCVMADGLEHTIHYYNDNNVSIDEGSYIEGQEGQELLKAGTAELPEKDEENQKIFLGWCEAKDLSGDILKKVNIEWNDDIDLYAYYADYYTVTWCSSDGKTELKATDMTEGSRAYFLDEYIIGQEYECPTPKNNSDKFIGWSKEPLGSEEMIKNSKIGNDQKENLTLYAVYEYTISYYYNKNLIGEGSYIEGREGQELLKAGTDKLPEKDTENQKIFLGWCTDPQSDEYLTKVDNKWSSDIELYAYYADYYTVTWCSSDGKTELKETDMTEDSQAYFLDEYIIGQEYKCPTPKNNSDKFIGWSKTPLDSEGFDIKEMIKNINIGNEENLTLYAVYKYTISYYYNENWIGEGSYIEGQEGQELLKAGTEELPEKDEENQKIFLGWCTDQQSDEYLTKVDNKWSSDIKLNAYYADYYTVTWYSLDGEELTADGMTDETAYFDKYMSKEEYICPTPKEIEGFTFIGWSEERCDIDNKIIKEISKGTKANLSLYAVYKGVHSITYYDGDTEIKEFSKGSYSYYKENDKLKDLPKANDSGNLPAERDGKLFLGWCEKNDLNGDILTKINSEWNGNIKLYACYEQYYTVTWYSSDGKTVLTADDMKDETTYFTKYTSRLTYACPTPVAEGQTFVDWSTKKNDSKYEYTISRIAEGTTGDLSFYAQFMKVSITPKSWVLNSDPSAAGGKLVMHLEGIEKLLKSGAEIYRSSENILINKISGEDYYVRKNAAYLKDDASQCYIYVVKYDTPIKVSVTFRDMPNILSLPTAMKEIKAEAFMNNERINGVSISGDKLTKIGSGAFKNCTELYFIELPDSVKTIADDAFEGSPNIQFYCNDDSYAAEYADAHDIPHSPLYSEKTKK